uniref:Large envelope protein n=1 Tax=Woodchuck hepatitis virus TaxID=35269 RepID=E1UGW4_9HEPA|nr:Large envelope protein [Woodchuck hepatitis virus]
MGNNIKVTFNPDKIAAWWPAVGTYYTTTYPQNQSVFQPGIYQTTSLINPKNQQELDSVLINRYKQIDWNTWQGFPVDQKLPLVSRDPPLKPHINQSAQTFEIKPGPIIVPGIRDIPRGLVPPQTPTNRDQGRKPTPPTPPLRDTHPHLTMKNQTFHLQGFVDGLRDLTTTERHHNAYGDPFTTLSPVVPTVSTILSPPSTTGDPALSPEMSPSSLLGLLAGLQVVYFLWTKILTIAQNLDWWWTSLSFPGGIPECTGQNSQFQTCKHLPTSCPPTCNGFRWMYLRRFIIYLLVLLLCLIFLLVLLDWKGLIPVCPLQPTTETTVNCRQCTLSVQDTYTPPYCCCLKPTAGNCTCWPIPSSWALGNYLWEWALARFSWLNLLVPLLQWLGGISLIAWFLLIWMIWFWGPALLSILPPFIPIFVLFFLIWVYI